MQIHTVVPYFDGQHGRSFHVLVENDEELIHLLNLIGNSSELDWFSVDEEDGFDLYEKLVLEKWGIVDSLRPTKNEEKEE